MAKRLAECRASVPADEAVSKLSLGIQKEVARLTVLGPDGGYVELDRKVDEAEGNGIMARWEFGLAVLAERGDRKQLPAGRLDEIAAAIGKSRREVQMRAVFAYLYPTPEQLRNVVAQLGSWHEIVSEGLAQTPRLAAPTVPAALPAGVFNVILADPPWRYDFAETDNRAIENQYPTLDVVEIAAFRDSAGVPIQSVVADDAVLFLWATSPKLREALIVMDGWGFEYVTQAVWVKDRIDEKVRIEDWPDFLLEVWSDHERRKPGWVAKDLECDFIAYAFVPSRRCYLLPFLTLRRAWQIHGREWWDRGRLDAPGYRLVSADNGSYRTVSVAVPIADLLDAMSGAQVATWSIAA